MGLASGAASSTAKQHQKWEQERERAQGIDVPAVEQQSERVADTRSGWQKFKDGFNTYINPKVGLFFTAVGLAAGALMASAYIHLGGLATSGANAAVPGMGLLLGGAAHNATAVTAYFVGVMGSFGALWNFNFPRIVNQAQHIAGALTSGRAFGTQWGPEPAKTVEATRSQETSPGMAPQEAPCGCKHKRFDSFQDMLAHRAQSAETSQSPTSHY